MNLPLMQVVDPGTLAHTMLIMALLDQHPRDGPVRFSGHCEDSGRKLSVDSIAFLRDFFVFWDS